MKTPRKSRSPKTAECEYTPTPEPRRPEYRCGGRLVSGEVCGALLRLTPTANRKHWQYVDEAGRTVLNESPAELIRDPAWWWADLAERDIAMYSAHKAAVDLAMFSWWHTHYPAPTEGRGLGAVPETCGRPMWSAPDGWVCRVHGTVFPYAEPE